MKLTRGRIRPSAGAIVVTMSALIVAMGAPKALAGQDHSPEQHEIVTLLERVSTLMESGDLEALDEIYAPGRGVHIIEGAGVNHGWIEYRDHHLAPELEAFENFSYRWHSIEARIVGDLAYAAFQYDLDATTERGEVAVEGRGTAILERMNGAWKIVHTHTSGRTRRGG